jgi:hypothetical protein
MIIPNAVTLVADATFFGRRSDRFGTLVFKDVLNDKIIASKHIESETVNDYKQVTQELLAQGFVIQGVTIDGKRGVAKALGSIPVQMCHFHQIAIIKRYLTRKPKSEASIELLKLYKRIPTSIQTRFADALSKWHGIYGAFLNDIVPLEGKKPSIQRLENYLQLTPSWRLLTEVSRLICLIYSRTKIIKTPFPHTYNHKLSNNFTGML